MLRPESNVRWTMLGLAGATLLAIAAFGVPEGLGCSGAEDASSAASAGDDLSASVCLKQHSGKSADGDALIICDQLYPSAPFVRPPADTVGTKGASSTLYLASTDSGTFTDRSGVDYVAVDSKGKQLGNSSMPSGMRMPSNRNLFFIYKTVGVVGIAEDPFGNGKVPSLQPKSAVPYILLSQHAIDTAVTVFEGTVSERTSPGSFDPNKLTPIRVTISSYGSARALPVWDNVNKGLPDGQVDELVGQIDNFSKPVKGSDGKCYPALSSLGAANPFSGAKTGAISANRMATMHFPGDQVFVFTYPVGTTGISSNGMGGLTILSPAGLLQTSGSDPNWGTQQIRPHAKPTGHIMYLHAVTNGAGGGGC